MSLVDTKYRYLQTPGDFYGEEAHNNPCLTLFLFSSAWLHQTKYYLLPSIVQSLFYYIRISLIYIRTYSVKCISLKYSEMKAITSYIYNFQCQFMLGYLINTYKKKNEVSVPLNTFKIIYISKPGGPLCLRSCFHYLV